MRRKLFFAVITLHVDLSELSDEGLLHLQLVVQLLLDGEFDLNSLGVRLGPNKAGIDDASAVETFDLLEEQGK